MNVSGSRFINNVAALPTTNLPLTAIGHGVADENIAFQVSRFWQSRATEAIDIPCSLRALASRLRLHSLSCL